MAVPVHSIKPQVAVHFTDVEIGWPITPQQLLSNPNQVSLKMASYSAKSSGLFKRPLFPRGSGRFGIFTIATEHNYSRSEDLLKVAKPQSNIHRSRLVELCGFFKMFCSCQSWIPQKRGRAQ